MPANYLFLDETGHHGLKTINQEFPILLLCGCIFEKSYFEKEFTESFNKLKLKYFDTTEIIFHSRDMRKWQKDFKILGDIKLRHEFYKDLNKLIANANLKIIATAILKDKLIKEFGPRSDNPYDLSLTFILENTVFLSWHKKFGQSKCYCGSTRQKRRFKLAKSISACFIARHRRYIK